MPEATERKRGPITVKVETVGEPIDVDAWVKRYVEIGLETLGALPPGGSVPEVDDRMGPTSPLPAARSR